MNSPLSASLVKTIPNLYEQDYYLWIDKTIQQLRDGKLSELDINNLIEEIADMGRSEKRAIQSNLKILLMHLLKYKYQTSKRSNSWKYTIREHRQRLQNAFTDSPSLKRYYAEIFDFTYQQARELAADETGLAIETFPEVSPFTTEDTLNPNYLPE